MISFKKEKTEAKQIVSTPNWYEEKTFSVEHSELMFNFDTEPSNRDEIPEGKLSDCLNSRGYKPVSDNALMQTAVPHCFCYI